MYKCRQHQDHLFAPTSFVLCLCVIVGWTWIGCKSITSTIIPCWYSWRKTRSHLEYLHLQILSVVTAAQLRRIFERRTNFDLRRLLNGKHYILRHPQPLMPWVWAGAETFMNSLLSRLEFDMAMSTSSLRCLKLDAALRSRAAEALAPTSKMKVSHSEWEWGITTQWF